MRRNYWIIIIGFMLAFVGIGGFLVTTVLMNIPKATAPAIEANITSPLTFYYISIGDDGKSGSKVGCGDSAVEVKTTEVTTDDLIKSTFRRLLLDHNQFYNETGLYNALYNSNLTFVGSSVSGDTVTVNLTGEFSLGGVCDIPRVQTMLEKAAQTAAGVNKAEILVNSKPLSEVLSLK